MKRFSVALATITAVLIVGTASARVPDGPSKATQAAGPRVAAVKPGTTPSQPPIPVGEELTVPGLADAEPERVAPALEAVELPAAVADILGSLPFAPPTAAGAATQEAAAVVAPAAPAGLALPAPVAPPSPKAAPAPKSKSAAPAPRSPRIPAQVADPSTALFPGLPATGHAAYTTGTVIHADALTGPSVQLADVEVAFSGSTFTSSALTGALTNEVERVVAPQLGVNNAYGRGSGLEIGLAQGEGAEGQIILANKAEAKAPPTTTLISNEVGPIDAAPVAVASLLRGQAQSRAAVACTTGVDLSYGQGYAANVSLAGSAIETVQPDPLRGVSQSTSRTRLVRQEGSTGPIAKFGLTTETRQTIAPVTLFDGALSFEFLGEWVLRATADGKTGSVTYGPGDVEPQTPLINITGIGSEPVVVLAQDLLGNEGLVLEVPGLGEIVIGEDARAIDGNAGSQPTETATLAAGAVDVVRIVLADGTLGDIRIGHMEAAVAVPAGGIECGIGLVKIARPESIKVGEEFDWLLTVSNPNDCVLTQLKVVDTISVTSGVKYTILSSDPKADSTTANSLTWNDVGPLQPGQSKELRIRMRVAPESSAGRFTDDAVATGVCGPAPGAAGAGAEAGVGVPLEARVTLNLPEVSAVLGEPLRGVLPRTGGLTSALPAMLLTALGVLLQRSNRRRGGS